MWATRPTTALLVSDLAGRVICNHCEIAETAFARMRGLLGRRSLGAGEGLLLRPGGAVHTAGMQFAIDVVFLSDDGTILHVAHNLQPWRMASKRGTRAVLELAAGEARWRGLEPGQKLELIRAPALAPEKTDEDDFPCSRNSEAELTGSAAFR